MIYHITGTSPFSGSHTKQEWWDKVVEPLMASVGGKVSIERLTVVAEGDWVCTHSRGQMTTADGKPYNHQYAHFFRVKDGKIAEIFEWLDTALTSAAFGDQSS